MKSTLNILIVIAFTVSGASGATIGPGKTLTFDDLPNPGADLPNVPNGYGGLNWSNFHYVNPVKAGATNSGAYNGIVSGTNLAFNGNGDPAAITSDQAFILNSIYMTSVWNDGLDVLANGYSGPNLVDSMQFTLDTSGPTLETFDWAGIDEVQFTSSGGTPNPAYAGKGGGLQFVMDNLTINVPEPSTLALLGAGAIGLLGYAWRRRR